MSPRQVALIGCDVLEEFVPALEISFADTVAMCNDAIATDRNLRRLSVNLQSSQHAFISVRRGPSYIFTV